MRSLIVGGSSSSLSRMVTMKSSPASPSMSPVIGYQGGSLVAIGVQDQRPGHLVERDDRARGGQAGFGAVQRAARRLDHPRALGALQLQIERHAAAGQKRDKQGGDEQHGGAALAGIRIRGGAALRRVAGGHGDPSMLRSSTMVERVRRRELSGVVASGRSSAPLRSGVATLVTSSVERAITVRRMAR